MPENVIVYPDDKSRVNLESVRDFMIKNYPSTTSTGHLFMNWETGPYVTMRTYPATDSRFKAAENEIIKLIDEVKRVRPNVKIGMYQMPFRFWYSNQNELYNGEGKFDNIFPRVDYIAPSYYILMPEEEVGEARVLQYLKENLEVALAYGKKFNKPVIPFVWHKVHPNVSEEYGGEIMQKEAFAKYINFIATYSFNNYKSAGVWWYDGLSDQLNDVSGINGCLKGTVYDKATYDAMITDYGKHVKQVLTEGTAAAPPAASQQVASFTLVDASTGRDIQQLTNGATLHLASLPSKSLNIRANTNPATVGSVVFALSGTQSKSATESTATYDMMGDNGSWTPSTGKYSIKATPFSAAKGGGTAGAALSISFTVTNETTDTSAPLVSEVTPTSGRNYALTSLVTGVRAYTDRTYQLTSVPSSLAGAKLIQTANDDKKSTASTQVTFELSESATVYIAYDPRASVLPSWLSGWQKAADRIGVDDSQISHMNLYSKTFAAGKVSLGGNKQSPAAGAENNYFVVAKAAQVSSVSLISNVSASSGRRYATGELASGSVHYTDRTYKITSVPASLNGAPFIRTANDDKRSTSYTQVSFELSESATVYIAYDPRASVLPSWLSGWQKAADRIGVDDSQINHMNLYSKTFAAGKVSLGGNMQSPAAGAENNYFVVVRESLSADASGTMLSFQGAISLEKSESSLTVYPNPNSGEAIHINLEGFRKSERVTIAIQDMLGRVVYSVSLFTDEAGSARMEMPVNRQLSRGIYIVNAGNNGTGAQSKLVVK
ncbi:T9SS type A sorting domain-containing protein [Pontibacter russatus]|uniref:T9SS type A sorting domain-containing protein n=1 Tax=Pontibacter russatus TaxID=2694929 RepID=UPI00137AEC9E|nr:T9SS type A sorting domain-containing protein [Pontibacter russatus]